MSQFDTTATIIMAGRAASGRAPAIDGFGGDIIDEDGQSLSIDAPATHFESGSVALNVREEALGAALMSLHAALADEAGSPVFEPAARAALHGLDIELIAARVGGATLIMMRLRPASQ